MILIKYEVLILDIDKNKSVNYKGLNFLNVNVFICKL